MRSNDLSSFARVSGDGRVGAPAVFVLAVSCRAEPRDTRHITAGSATVYNLSKEQ